MSISNYASLNSPIHRKLWLQGFLTESERQVIIDAASGFCDPVALGMLICTLSANDIETLKVKAEAIHPSIALWTDGMWFDGVHTYYSWPPCGLLPYKRWDLEIDVLVVKCQKCDGKTDSLRGQAVEYDACTEIRIGAYCPDCNMITYARTRIYPDSHVTWELPGGWRELVAKRPFWFRLKRFIRALLQAGL